MFSHRGNNNALSFLLSPVSFLPLSPFSCAVSAADLLFHNDLTSFAEPTPAPTKLGLLRLQAKAKKFGLGSTLKVAAPGSSGSVTLDLTDLADLWSKLADLVNLVILKGVCHKIFDLQFFS